MCHSPEWLNIMKQSADMSEAELKQLASAYDGVYFHKVKYIDSLFIRTGVFTLFMRTGAWFTLFMRTGALFTLLTSPHGVASFHTSASGITQRCHLYHRYERDVACDCA